ncbi:MAG: nickel-type superoxide dismutase maturation protease [Actinobacteria bacterium]|nr:nickel-type superoxide dismutase maturation protease [Actinomycetota bacterium]
MAALATWALLSRFERVAVVGDSMDPALLAGDRLLVRKLRRPGSLHPGDIVVAPDPREPERALVKRVVTLDGSSAYLAGDNPSHSTDSRQFGPIPLASVVGRAFYRYAPPLRAGRLA